MQVQSLTQLLSELTEDKANLMNQIDALEDDKIALTKLNSKLEESLALLKEQQVCENVQDIKQ